MSLADIEIPLLDEVSDAVLRKGEWLEDCGYAVQISVQRNPYPGAMHPYVVQLWRDMGVESASFVGSLSVVCREIYLYRDEAAKLIRYIKEDREEGL